MKLVELISVASVAIASMPSFVRLPIESRAPSSANAFAIPSLKAVFPVLKGFDFAKYKPKAVSIEFIDPAMKKEEFYHQSITNVINSEVYKYMKNHNYHFVNW